MSASPVFIITGASRGIGKAAVFESLLKFNACVVAVARSGNQLDNLFAVAGKHNKQENLALLQGDVTDDTIQHQAVKLALDRWGRLDAVIANAGVLEPIARVANSSIDGWKKLFDVNVFSVIGLVQKALPHLRESKGRIIIVSSGAATTAYAAWGAYGASKAAVKHLTATLGVEEPNVTSIAVRPGVVDTDMQVLIRETGKDEMKDFHRKFVDLHEKGKLLRPEQPAHVIASLAARASHELSGQQVSWDDDELAAYREE